MQTQESADTQKGVAPEKSKRVAWLTGLALFALAALLATFSATAFAYWHAPQSKILAKQAPHAKTWEHVLDGYTIASIIAAPSNPTTLYACAIPTSLTSSTPSIPYRKGLTSLRYTLLRSVDGGKIWKEVGALEGACQIAVNPTNSNDIYTSALAGNRASNGQAAYVLKHSSDGGRSWSDIAPTLAQNSAQRIVSTTWYIQQLTMVSTRLFGIQQFQIAAFQPRDKTVPATSMSVSRLVESSDGGHTWVMLDGSIAATNQSVREYVVSPSNSQTIYELVGPALLPMSLPIMPKALPPYSNTLTLSKTTDGGATWKTLLQTVQYNSKIQLARNNPALVYVGGFAGSLHFGPQNDEIRDLPPMIERFTLTMSKDGGVTWQTVKQPTNITFVQNWFVNADGQAYVSTGTTATRPIMPVVPVGGVTAIQRYDTSSATWSIVTQTPPNGVLLTTTTGEGQTTLWFLNSSNNTLALYRFVNV